MLLSAQARRRGAAADRRGARQSAGGARVAAAARPLPRRWPRPASASAARALLVGDGSGAQGARPRPAAARASRSTRPPRAFAELLSGIAIGLARGEDRALPLSLVQIARHAAPDNSEAHLLGALLLERRGRAAAALAALARIPADDPFAEDALDASARLLLAEKRGAEALALAQRSAEPARCRARPIMRGSAMSSTSWDARPRRPTAFARGGGARRCRAGRPNRWTYRLLGAAQLDKLKRWPEAQRAARTGAQGLSPDEPLLLNYLGYNSVERGENLDAAEAMIRRALALRPDDASITDSLGWALYKRGRLPEAIATLAEGQHRRPRAVRDQRASRRCPVTSRGGGSRRASRGARRWSPPRKPPSAAGSRPRSSAGLTKADGRALMRSHRAGAGQAQPRAPCPRRLARRAPPDRDPVRLLRRRRRCSTPSHAEDLSLSVGGSDVGGAWRSDDNLVLRAARPCASGAGRCSTAGRR